ncbi:MULTISPECIES: energy-coupling factor transporter transmembrane component T family protein [Subtercola]|uniref:Energy-coupling factor transporter transmembrane protein EcfT n=1 Tax=Subtercola vilae TaxID=2056433 RepID=A0A4T2C3L7_9MICO|nr:MULTISPECIES: energy-coupling factor transporter transmembrane component T [Subtercola]MEA9986185.1 energy-coupling factor transporter transmembrane component T [Subtercola sp. RTI3]TIH38309.1 energy-coupling factor transporter transmembrane protein EcfT [Subtercola vilae]
MSILTPTRGTHVVYSINPVAKLAAAFVLSFTLVLSIDWVSASVALVLEGILFLWAGLSARQFFLRTLPVWVAAPAAAVTTVLYGRPAGATYFQLYLIHVTDGSFELALATLLRVLAIGLPAVVLFVTIDPTDLADGLAQVLHLPSRFVLGGLAGLRLVGLFLDDWRSLQLARRARGVGDSGRIRRFFSQGFALLVLSIRRGSKLATAMEARGFGSTIERTYARESRFGWREAVLIALAALVALVAVTVSVSTGTWNFIGSAS